MTTNNEIVIEGEEVIEMGQDKDGVYKPVAVRRHHKPGRIVPRQTRIPIFYEFLDGFSIGMDAIENFLRTLDRFGGRR